MQKHPSRLAERDVFYQDTMECGSDQVGYKTDYRLTKLKKIPVHVLPSHLFLQTFKFVETLKISSKRWISSLQGIHKGPFAQISDQGACW